MTAETVQPLRPDSEPAPLPEVLGGFKTVLADPPWRFTNRTGKVAPEHRRLDRYSTMTLAAIKDIEVADAAAKNAHLYLWVPNALLPDGLAVMEAWGFRYVSNVVWASAAGRCPDGRGVGFTSQRHRDPAPGSWPMRSLAPARRQVNMIETRSGTQPQARRAVRADRPLTRPAPGASPATRGMTGDEFRRGRTTRAVHRGYAGVDTPDRLTSFQLIPRWLPPLWEQYEARAPRPRGGHRYSTPECAPCWSHAIRPAWRSPSRRPALTPSQLGVVVRTATREPW